MTATMPSTTSIAGTTAIRASASSTLPPAPTSGATANECPARGTDLTTPTESSAASESSASSSSAPEPKGEADARRGPAPVLIYTPQDRLGWSNLRMLAECLADAQAARISISNKLRRNPNLAELALEPERAEAALAKAMRKSYRVVVPKPIRQWQVESHGVGEHLLARLLGQIGHPAIAVPQHWEGTGAKRVLVADDPHLRTLRGLWAYCGHGDPERSRRTRGMSADDVFAAGNPRAKMIVHLIAEAAIKQPKRRWTPEKGGHWSTDNDLSDAQDTNDSHTPVGVAEHSSCAHHPLDCQCSCGAGTILDDAQDTDDSQYPVGAVDPSPCAQPVSDIQGSLGAGDDSPHAHERGDSHGIPGVWKYRAVYEMARDRYVARTHASSCVRCGPSGHPADEGTPWSAAHQHAAALRLVGKEVLRDLWRASGGGADQ